MDYEKLYSFLGAQKNHLIELDNEEVDSGKDRHIRKTMYENTINWFKTEGRHQVLDDLETLRGETINEDTLSTSIATLTTHLMPAIRRIFNRLIAMDLVSVQPMNGPTGIIYWYESLFGTTGGGATSGDLVHENRYDSFANSSEQGTIRELDWRLRSKTITAVTKKIKSEWTIEAEQDLKSQWGLSLENELIPMLITEMTREVDGQIITALEAGVAHNVNWNTNGALTEDVKYTFHQKEYDATLYDAILEADNEVLKVTHTHCNWLVMHPDVYLRLAKLEQFNADPMAVNNEGGVFRSQVGVLSGQLWAKVYVDPDFTANKILMGIKSNDWRYAVGYYAPYIPLFTSAKYIKGDDFTQFLRGAMTRYAYGVIPYEASGTYSGRNKGLASVELTSS